MEKRVFDIISETNKEIIWFLNHDHIYTMGTSSKKADILESSNVPVIKTNRGGQITYHGPGQRIVYLLINLQKREKDIKKFVNAIERSAINLLKKFDIESKTYPDRIGIWVTGKNKTKFKKEEKIGAIGLRLKKWVTYHGLSFNINPELKYYENINACGLSEYSTTSMHSLGVKLSNKEFDDLYLKFFLDELKRL